MSWGNEACAVGRANTEVWPLSPAAVAGPPATPEGHKPAAEQTGYPELDCIRDRLSPGLIAAAERRAADIGVGADRTLIAGDIVSEEAYLAALTAAEGFSTKVLEDAPREAIPLTEEQLLNGAAVGIIPFRSEGTLHFAITPRSHASRRLIDLARGGSETASRFAFITGERFQQFTARIAQRALTNRATNDLRRAQPDLSAAAGNSKSWKVVSALAAIILAILVAPFGLLQIVGYGFGVIFLAWSILRLVIPLFVRGPEHPRNDFAAHSLPTYTIIVALYREVAAARSLVVALRKLDYPKEKLDIKFVLEADDRATRAHLETMRLGAAFEIIITPPGEPRTKPRALNVALPFARGSYVAIYDAEDRPEPDQLRRALDAFATGNEQLACVQAQLTIDNTKDNWLTRLFTAEYAGLFDVFLPALATLKLPLPLGGSSNHFRSDILRRVRAWDPHNVTEDADLGMRLARLGYGTTVISSSTYEEAPARLGSWIKQRTRWMKGWMQTWLVHMRSPRKLLRELGVAGFCMFQMLVGGSVLAALVHPVVLLTGWWEFASIGYTSPCLAMLLTGYVASAALGLYGLAKRKLLTHTWVLLLTPIYWLLLSLAAWRALYQLLLDPYGWEKTEHGLARNSRLSGDLGTIPAEIRDISAARPRHPQAVA